MDIELKNIKVLLQNSDETYCYSAMLYVDGCAIGRVANAGHGGCDDFQGDWAKYTKADAWVAQNMPPVDLSDYGIDEPSPQSLEGLCHSLVGKHLDLRALKARMKRRVVFIRNGDLMECRYQRVKLIEPHHVARFRMQNPNDIVLNGMQEDAALALWRDPSSVLVGEAARDAI